LSELSLLDVTETLTPADHQTHRRYRFEVPAAAERIQIHVRYSPKSLSPADSAPLVAATLEAQRVQLAHVVGEVQAREWVAEHSQGSSRVAVANLLTISLDDARGVYRGAGHRHVDDQQLTVARDEASPGLVPGPLPPGSWALTLSAHTVASPQCEVSIQIGAETASSAP
jgi:hypothetical protein